LEPERAWNAALGALAALGLASLGYWTVGFALQFGGVGLVYGQPGLRGLVWEWSPFSADWGIGWGVAGLNGWFLSGPDVTPTVYALFLGHLPWVITAAALPVIALRGRAPATATLIIALLMGTVVYPVAGNWVQGGGWLSALGRNLTLGHGFVDFGGAGSVHLVAAGFALAALLVWMPRRPRRPLADVTLTPAQLPLLSVVGSLFILAGTLGWLWSNPLQVATLSETALLRGSVNVILCAGGGLLIPLLYTWFVTGGIDPVLSARGLAAGAVASLALAPFVQPGAALGIGLLVGATVPFVTFVLDGLLRLDDATGAVVISAVPAMLGLLFAGIFADGATGLGWQMTGLDGYLGVTGQGVSGLLVTRGYQPDFPGQLQAQLIGIVTLALWGFLLGALICTPLGLILHSLAGQRTPGGVPPTPVDVQATLGRSGRPAAPFAEPEANPRAQDRTA
jgi:Amt family ammonium transporter